MSRQSQCDAVLNRLKQGPATTWQLGYGLNICCVTRRIFELRQEGHVITKSEQRLSGKRIVTYTLMGQTSLFPDACVLGLLGANAGHSTAGQR